MTYFYHIEWIFDNYDLNILESTDLQIPNHHILIQILSWVKLIPRNCNFTGWALAVSASKVKPRSFFLMYYGVSNCFRSQHLSFCLHWVTTSTCSTMFFLLLSWQFETYIKNPNNSVRGGGGNWMEEVWSIISLWSISKIHFWEEKSD